MCQIPDLSLYKATKCFMRRKGEARGAFEISLDAYGGEIFGLVGANGAGKTTILRLITDILRPDSGQILIDGNPRFNRTAEFRAMLGYLPEERGLYTKRTLHDNLLYLGMLHGLDRQTTRQRLTHWLDFFDIAQYEQQKVSQLSKGLAQKAQLIACLIHEPRFVLLDEPFSGLDPINRRALREVIRRLRKEGKLVLLSTHLLGEIQTLCDRMLLIQDGRTLLNGSVQEIRKQFSAYDLCVQAETDLSLLDCVEDVKHKDDSQLVRLASGFSYHNFLGELSTRQCQVSSIERTSVSLEDVFVSLVGKNESKDSQQNSTE